jgi:hypothetical protein
MKTTVLPCLAALTSLLAAEPRPMIDRTQIPNAGLVSNPEPNAPARMAVMTQIVARLQPPAMPPFSRAVVVTPHPSFRPVELVDGEERLPFMVTMRGRGAEVSGYVRVSDNAIFIRRPEKKDHIRSTLDPRFAPPEKAVAKPKDPA